MEIFINKLAFTPSMNKLELKEIVLSQKNEREQKGIIQRDVSGKINELGKTAFIVVISGVRRCGKSTLLNQIRRAKEGHYLDFDDDRLINFQVEDFQKLYEIFLEVNGEHDVFYFDEIQNVKAWELFVRRIHDGGKKVYVTGSNASMLSRELGTHLTGRHLPLTLWPFSFREFLTLTESSGETPFTTKGKAALKNAFNQYLEKGGIPEYLKTRNKDYLKILYENILYRDVLVRYKLTNEKPMKELVRFISSNVSKEISFNSLKKTLGLGSSTTVKEYFDYLENCYLVFLVPKFASSLKKQVYANKKAYLVDTAIAINNGYRLSKDIGRLFENLVFIELKRRYSEIYYFKEKSECDFVVKGKDFEAIQVCYDLREDNKERELAGLTEAMKKLRLCSGILLTYDNEEELNVEGKKIMIKPVWKWLLE